MKGLLGTLMVVLGAWALAASGCSGGGGIGPARTVEVRPATSVASVAASPSAAASAVAAETPPPTATPSPTAATPSPSTPVVHETTAPAATPRPPSRPESGRWIDVDVSRFVVTLMDGRSVLRTIAPVAVGREVDTGVYNSTATGLFYVYSKTEDLAYDPPYDTYISHWVGFDPRLDNGFHSFLKDKDGKVVDASTGRVSNGCIRTGDPSAIFTFATIGMPVWVHT